ncbi:hypothetical protein Q7P37_001799 [Cladosporium fusiforme]
MAAKAIPEEEILRERDPAFEYSSDDWPEFELKDAKATAYYPLTLTGFLQPLPKAQAHLQLKPTTQRAPLIEISDVRTFSYGQFEDGNIGLWAGGKAGWYALKPARGYRSIWNEMVQSVDIFYWIVDAYREERRGSDRKNAQLLPEYTVEELFDKYAEEVIEDSHGRDEAAQVLYEHKDFLLASMLAGKEGIAWAKNPLYTHLSQRFPEEHAVIKSRLTGRAVPARYARQASVNSEASNLKRKRARPGREASEGITSTRENSTTDVATQQQLASRRSRRNQRDSADTDTPEPEYSTPQRSDELHRRSMKGRSALRPKASKASKGASKGGKAPVPNFVDDDDDEDDPAISPTAAKRRHSNHSAQIRSHNRSRKDDLDEGIDIPSSPEQEESTPSDTHPGAVDKDSSDEDEEDAEPGTDLALRLKHEPDPIQEDTWVCALDGCTHKVYQASLVDSQRLIREHYALHAYDDDERVQLVKKLQHPSLPVGHLMERVRLQARTEGFPASRSALEGANAHSRYRPAPQVRY